MIEVSVKLFASLRDQYPEVPIGQPMSIPLAEGATLEELIRTLDLNAVKIIFVNGVAHTDLKHALHDNDDIAVFPPLAGG
jgi:molybdopterin converting factor small subunit